MVVPTVTGTFLPCEIYRIKESDRVTNNKGMNAESSAYGCIDLNWEAVIFLTFQHISKDLTQPVLRMFSYSKLFQCSRLTNCDG